jgi:hypothetical protein
MGDVAGVAFMEVCGETQLITDPGTDLLGYIS